MKIYIPNLNRKQYLRFRFVAFLFSQFYARKRFRPNVCVRKGGGSTEKMSVHTIFILYIYLRIIKAVVYPYASNSHMRYYWWFFELFLTENQFQWKQICPILIVWILTMHAAMAKIPVVLNHIFDIQLIVWYITLTRLTNSHYLYEFVLRKKCIPKSFSIS